MAAPLGHNILAGETEQEAQHPQNCLAGIRTCKRTLPGGGGHTSGLGKAGSCQKGNQKKAAETMTQTPSGHGDNGHAFFLQLL